MDWIIAGIFFAAGITLRDLYEWVKRRWEKEELLYNYKDVKEAWKEGEK